jgi:hypothetical protein
MKVCRAVDIQMKVYLTMTLVEGGVVGFTVYPSLAPENEPSVPVGYEAGWVKELVWTTFSKKNPLSGARTPTSRPRSPQPFAVQVCSTDDQDLLTCCSYRIRCWSKPFPIWISETHWSMINGIIRDPVITLVVGKVFVTRVPCRSRFWEAVRFSRLDANS